MSALVNVLRYYMDFRLSQDFGRMLSNTLYAFFSRISEYTILLFNSLYVDFFNVFYFNGSVGDVNYHIHKG